MTTGTVPEPYDAAAEPRSIDLFECWQIVRRRWPLVLVVTLLSVITGAGYAYASGPTYAATAEVVVTGLTQGPLSQSAQTDTQVNMSTEQAVAQSPPVVAQSAGILRERVATLQVEAVKRLSVAVPASTLTTSNVLQITWKAKTPAAAQAGANAFATAYLSYRHRQLAGQVASLQSALNRQITALGRTITRLNAQGAGSGHGTNSIRLSQLTSELGTAESQLSSLPTYNDSGGSVIGAARPSSPSGLGHAVVLAVAALLGVLIGLALAFMRDALDDRVREPDQLERKLGAPTLATLPPADTVQAGGHQVPEIITARSPESRDAESVRALRATLVAVAQRRSLRTILIVAADSNVSTGRLAAELGVSLAESGHGVLLVAADLRGSALPQIFDLPNTSGLSDLLVEGGDPAAQIWQPRQAAGVKLPGVIARRMGVLPSGPPFAHALPIMDSPAMNELLASRRENYQFVLLDSPPVTLSADAFAVAGRADGVIVVARAARSRGRAVTDLRRRLDQVGAVLIGGVFIGKGSGGRHRPGTAATPRGPSLSPSRPAADPQQRPAEPPPQAAAPSPATSTQPMRDDMASGTAGGAAKRA